MTDSFSQLQLIKNQVQREIESIKENTLEQLKDIQHSIESSRENTRILQDKVNSLEDEITKLHEISSSIDLLDSFRHYSFLTSQRQLLIDNLQSNSYSDRASIEERLIEIDEKLGHYERAIAILCSSLLDSSSSEQTPDSTLKYTPRTHPHLHIASVLSSSVPS